MRLMLFSLSALLLLGVSQAMLPEEQMLIRAEPVSVEGEHELVRLRQVLKGETRLRRIMGHTRLINRVLQVRRGPSPLLPGSQWLGLDAELRVLWQSAVPPNSSSHFSSRSLEQSCVWTAFEKSCPPKNVNTKDDECQHFPCQLFVDVLATATRMDAPDAFFKPDRVSFNSKSNKRGNDNVVHKGQEDSYMLLPFTKAFEQSMDKEEIAILANFRTDIEQGIVFSMRGRDSNSTSSSLSLEINNDSIVLRTSHYRCQQILKLANNSQEGIELCLRLSTSGWLEVFDRCSRRLRRRLQCPLVLDDDPDLVVGFMFRGELRELMLLNGFDEWRRLNRRCERRQRETKEDLN